MKNLEILSEQEMRAINGGGLISSIVGIVTGITSAIQTGIKFILSFFI
jgi:hypothetical protein